MRRRAAPIAAAVLLAGLAGLAIAQQQQARRPVLHEDFPVTTPPGPQSPMIGGPAHGMGSGGNPTAFTAGDKVLPHPAMEQKPGEDSKGEPVLGSHGFAADRETTAKGDYSTESDPTLHYASVFNPDVLPFKRMSALDGVADDETLRVDHTAISEIPVGGTTDKTRDRFWGSMLIDLAPGQDVPLPSVAPDMRVLSYEIKPNVRLRFEKDGADNFYVRTDEPKAGGTYRLVFLCDADGGYFAPQLPAHRMTPAQVAAQTPPELRVQLPENVRKDAEITLGHLGVDRGMDLGVAFNKLVENFRGFEAKAAPPRTGDVYRDLCDSKAGVCRHRAFAFTITAIELGIPTRFVSNEAHAFVEVWFPGRRWQRIDLGGAALHMDVTGADNKTLHRPRAEDPFEKPAAYKQSYTQLEGDIKGLTSQQIDDKHKPLDAGTASGSFDGGSGSGSGATPPPDRITPDPTLPYATQDPHKATPVLIVTTADASAYRGDAIHVEGRASANGKPIPDHDVSVFLSPAGAGGAKSMFIGTAVTGPDGGFKQDFSVPSGIGVATYDIWLSSSEDAYYNAALSVQ
ncbi:MAG TPA: transglutaminase domain-containing protein [Kofleriaceae bacterium]